MTTTVAPTTATPPQSPLRWLADTYEQAQRVRIETGERIRAIIQGRDRTFTVRDGTITQEDPDDVETARYTDPADGIPRTADATLDAIGAQKIYGPVLLLGRTYQRHWEEEREVYKEMSRALREHPAFPWLTRVRGIGPTLACKLLARFDATRAPYASSFWAYAGLDTIPGALYRCAVCGVERTFPPTYNVTGAHKRGGSGTVACTGALTLVPNAEVRVARPRPAAGEKSRYDAYAKKVLYLVGTSFLKAGAASPYEQHYRKHRARLDEQRPGWAEGRRHLTALRITEKLFLAHLWEVWRTALGLPTPRPWIEVHGGHDPSSYISPWDMVTPTK